VYTLKKRETKKTRWQKNYTTYN